MAQPQHTPSLARLEEAVIVLFCLIDDAYSTLTTLRERTATKPSNTSRTLRSSLSPSCSNSEGWRASAPSCATPSGSSRICSLG